VAAPEQSRYLDYLPAVLQEPPDGGESMLGRFLLAFEHVMTGRAEPPDAGIEEILDGIPQPLEGEAPLRGIERFFDPGPGKPEKQRTESEFLDWLSGWVALALRADLGEEQQRDLIAQTMSLYRLRGTRAGLARMLAIYLGGAGATIEEFSSAFQIGVTSTVGEDTILGGGAPHFFRVLLNVTDTAQAEVRGRVELARAIVDAERPAHTYFTVEPIAPVMQIEVHSTVGVDTLLGGDE
jgi:phage tail-like protein